MSNPARLASIEPVSRKRKVPECVAPRAEPIAPNRLLVGYLAHEFLTSGTILDQPWDSKARSEPGKNLKPGSDPSGSGPGQVKEIRAYSDIALILKTDGAHIPGVVNPTQLAQWLRR
ncbi:hypothetical protein FCM35_KLT20361 [Carex littledalei]|uniref:Embryo sac development arrest 6 n=1 Tax=Carex littledalei TaxID=544730 RepID=A0A833RJ45_9POAL|nr:hypothetical protein FCM35_KLT20361 [Carex littledalei]